MRSPVSQPAPARPGDFLMSILASTVFGSDVFTKIALQLTEAGAEDIPI
ncbi:MAG: hypothetical protein L3J56_03750 [Bacteroidales bacterium]|nr:hypothetical protein [Bacteroidales bacterium]